VLKNICIAVNGKDDDDVNFDEKENSIFDDDDIGYDN
jgi:hypothetical protein